MTNKPVSIRYGSYTLNFHSEEDFWKDFTDLARKMFGHGGTKKIISELAAEWYLKYENKGGMDQFLDPNHIPIPDINSLEENTLKYLKTLNNDTIHEFMDKFYRLHILCKALQDCDDKKNFSLDYVTAWRKYK